MDIQIIECDFKNAEHLKKLVELTGAYMRDPMGGGEQMSNKIGENLSIGLANHPACLILFALADNQYAGICTSFINFSTLKAKPYFNVHDIAVKKEYRGNGIGRKLLETLINKAQECGYCKITLEVRDDNYSAKKLYQSLGFKDSEPHMHFWTRKLL